MNKMYQPVIDSIQSYASLSEAEIQDFTDRLLLCELKKGDRILEIGEVCQDWSFIVTGSFRAYYLDEDLNEITTNLFLENSWMLNHASFTGQKPAKSKLEAFEDSTVLSINIEDLHLLIGKSPAYFGLGKILETKHESDHPKASPEEKYQKLISAKPKLIQKFPLKYIASYLGMTPETLSRVRNRIR